MHPTGRLGRAFRLAVFGACVIACVAPAQAQFTPFPHDARNVLEGNWQSCRQPDGTWLERVYDHVVGTRTFELHLGPRREFALFLGVQDDHRDHASPDNLLQPFRVPVVGTDARGHWDIPSLGLALTATLAGGSRTDCDSWFIVLGPPPPPSF